MRGGHFLWFVANNYLLFNSSVVRIFLAHSHIFCNMSSVPDFNAKSQGVFPCLSEADNTLFLSPLLLLLLLDFL